MVKRRKACSREDVENAFLHGKKVVRLKIHYGHGLGSSKTITKTTYGYSVYNSICNASDRYSTLEDVFNNTIIGQALDKNSAYM